jgi:acid stress-induced BolA-like protein IbaG/YrbA
MGQRQASAATRAFTARVEHRRAVVVNEAAENKARANRERRLSAALRENLKRRKVQARARSMDTRTSDAAPAHDSAGIREKDKEEA